MVFKIKLPAPARNRPRVLFVDDMKDIHEYTSRIARKIGIVKRTAYFPPQAELIIKRRLTAIKKLTAKLKAKLATTKNPKEKKLIEQKLGVLLRLEKAPFDLLVSDVNMPHNSQTGIKFVKGVRQRLPAQKILMHSDDQRSLDDLRENGFDYLLKKSPETSERELEERIKQELWPKKYKRKLTDDDWF